MRVNPQVLLNSLLCNSNSKFPMWKGHYVTGQDIVVFSNLACIENSLTNLTCKCKNLFGKNTLRKL